MKTISYYIYYFALIFTALFLSYGCSDDEEVNPTETGQMTLEFQHMADGENLSFGTNYQTSSGDTVNFSKFDYYISNFELVKSDGSIYTVPKNSCYFLIKHTNNQTQKITLSEIPSADYKGINFIIGVDSLKSCSPASERTGVLDPAGEGAGMYWAWNSGYIFLKAEGSSPQAPLNTANNRRDFKYHIGLFGGYDSPTINNIQKVSVHTHDGSTATVRKDLYPNMHFEVNVLEIFKSPHTISIAENPVLMVSPDSRIIAENYADMFQLMHIEN